jgi:hypothetical protein
LAIRLELAAAGIGASIAPHFTPALAWAAKRLRVAQLAMIDSLAIRPATDGGAS